MMNKIIAGVVIAAVMLLIMYVPEEPESMAWTAEDCAKPEVRCYYDF